MKLKSALNKLYTLVKDGIEFPDAESKVLQEFKLTSKQMQVVVEMYDNQEFDQD